jgi:hypothetical protein
MTTYPIGYLSAAWIAFEDIHPASGPLLFYPGSHRLPYVFSTDVGITESDFKEHGYTSYAAKYEPYIRRVGGGARNRAALFPRQEGRRPDLARQPHPWRLHAPEHTALAEGAGLSFLCEGRLRVSRSLSHKSRQQYLGTCLVRDQSGAIRWLPKAGKQVAAAQK